MIASGLGCLRALGSLRLSCLGSLDSLALGLGCLKSLDSLGSLALGLGCLGSLALGLDCLGSLNSPGYLELGSLIIGLVSLRSLDSIELLLSLECLRSKTFVSLALGLC